MARRCPDCGKQVSEAARTCMNCGCSLRLRRVQQWLLRIVGGLALVGFLYGLVWVGLYVGGGDIKVRNDMVGAYFKCHALVKARLTSARHVSFPAENYQTVSKRLREDRYRVASFADAHYDTGPTRRYDYTCTVDYRGYHLWPLPNSGKPWRVLEFTLHRRPR